MERREFLTDREKLSSIRFAYDMSEVGGKALSESSKRLDLPPVIRFREFRNNLFSLNREITNQLAIFTDRSCRSLTFCDSNTYSRLTVIFSASK